jgi:chromosome segregation ATPase
MSTDSDTPSALTPSPEQPLPVTTATEIPNVEISNKTPPTDVNEENTSPQVPSNVNFEKERAFFETNKDNLKNKIAYLQSELEEERQLADTLADKDAADDAELANIRQFLNTNSDEISLLHNVVKNINDALKELVKNNKLKQEELKAQNEEYASLVNSDQARNLAGKIKDIRTILGQLEDFLVKEGVQGPKSPQ